MLQKKYLILLFSYYFQLIFGSKETFELMHCLEELTKDRVYLNSDNAEDVSILNPNELPHAISQMPVFDWVYSVKMCNN